ncbi:MAG: 2-oxoacid:acceptor oxidoreductase family protein [Halobacteriota archaeon]|nr:2-oxoacid:acceptor oxidoreductase family protein [Halobacteriota archaeon]
MSTKEIRFAGSGGQGLVFSSIVLAKAASIYEAKSVTQKDSKLEKKRDNIFAVQTNTCDAAVRGGGSRAEVKISDEEILFPHVETPDILVLRSEEAFEMYGHDVKEDSITILDPETVKSRPKNRFYEVPAISIAETMGSKIVANVIILGALCAISGIVSIESMKKALLDSIPAGTEEINLRALDKGFDIGKRVKAGDIFKVE